MESTEGRRSVIRGAICLIVISLIPLVSAFATIPLIAHDSEFASGEPVGSDGALCLFALLGLLFSAKDSFAVKPRDALAVIFLTLWGTGVSSEYNSAGLAVETYLLGLICAQVSHDTHRKFWNVLLLCAVCWINSSLYSFGLAFFFWLVPVLDQSQATSDESRPIRACALIMSSLLLLFYQHMALAPIASVGISAYVFKRKDAKVHEKAISCILTIVASILVHPLLTVLMVSLFFVNMQSNLSEPFKDGDIESLLGVVLLRELVMPSPGLSRLGSISTMSGLLVCIVSGMILNQCVERVSQKVGYLLEDYGLKVVLAYLFLGLFQRTLNVNLGPFLIILVGATILVLHMFVMLLMRINTQSEQSITRLLFCSVLWLTFAFALSTLLPHESKTWYDLNNEEQKTRCAERVLLGQGQWFNGDYSSKYAVSNMDAYFGGETATCRTFYPEYTIEYWKQKKILVIGDSVGRFVFYGLANILVSNQYGFPTAKYHSDITATESLGFHWAAFINDTVNSTELADSADLVIVSLGLWDKLWRTKTVQQYGDNAKMFLEKMNALGKKPKIAWVEMTPTIEQNLIGKEKQQYLREVDADLWRDQVRNATNAYKGDISIIPTRHLTSGRTSHDGVHYDMHVYMVMAETILRGLR